VVEGLDGAGKRGEEGEKETFFAGGKKERVARVLPVRENASQEGKRKGET